METMAPTPEYSLRPATAADAAAIRRLIHLVHINPTGLDWQRFLLAVDREGRVIGSGQVKPHGDGSRELASIAVMPGWRGRGIARQVIERLLREHPGTLYLTCRSIQGPFYEKFGFQALSLAQMPPYFQRLSRMVNLVNKLFRQPDILLVMKRG